MSEDLMTREDIESFIAEELRYTKKEFQSDIAAVEGTISENISDIKSDHEYVWKQIDRRLEDLEKSTEGVDFNKIISEYSLVEQKILAFEKRINLLLAEVEKKEKNIKILKSRLADKDFDQKLLNINI